MTYKWQERRGSKRFGHLAAGAHFIVTEVQNLDEALDELKRRSARAKQSATQRAKKRTLKQIFSAAKLQAAGKLAVERKKKNKPPKSPDPFAWETAEERDAMIRRLHTSGYWSARDLGRKFKLKVADILEIIKQR